jgi:hypothetical protein
MEGRGARRCDVTMRDGRDGVRMASLKQHERDGCVCAMGVGEMV